MQDPFRIPTPSSAIRNSRVKTFQATIRSHCPLTHDTDELVVVCAPNEPTLIVRAGQFATLHFPGIAKPRPYSFARDPAAGPHNELRFYIKKIPGGEVSEWLASGDRSGIDIEIAAPLGNFALDQTVRPMLCIAGGSGLSAVLAIIQQAARERVARDCLFLYGARAQADLYGAVEIQDVAARWHPDHEFRFIEVLSEEPTDSGWSGPRGIVTNYVQNTWLANQRAEPLNCSAFLCGPPAMIAAATTILSTAGLPESQIFRDVFEDASSPAPVIDNRRCVLCDECLLVRPVKGCIVESAGLAFDDNGDVSKVEKVVPGHSSGLYYNTLFVDDTACIRCYACVNACPHDAISPDHAVNNTLRQTL